MEVYTTDIVGRTRVKFIEKVDMALVQQDIDLLFDPLVQKADFFYEPKNITLKGIEYTNFNISNQTIDVALQFEEPFELGLIIDQSDFIYFFVNQTYDWENLI